VATDNLKLLTLVRNPWDRMVSMYQFYRPYKEFSIEGRSFDEWIRFIYSDSWPKERVTSAINMLQYSFGNQLGWLDYATANTSNSRATGRVEWQDDDKVFYRSLELGMTTRVLRFERYEDEVKPFVLRELGLDSIRVENEHASAHAPYCSYYTPETRELVRMHYARDIEELKYSFPETCPASSTPAHGVRARTWNIATSSPGSTSIMFDILTDLDASTLLLCLFAVVEEAVDSVKSPTHFETSPSDNNRLQCRRPCDEWKPPGLVKLPLELL